MKLFLDLLAVLAVVASPRRRGVVVADDLVEDGTNAATCLPLAAILDASNRRFIVLMIITRYGALVSCIAFSPKRMVYDTFRYVVVNVFRRSWWGVCVGSFRD